MGDGSTPDPDAPFYTLGLSSLTAAQFSGLLEQVRSGVQTDTDKTPGVYLVDVCSQNT